MSSISYYDKNSQAFHDRTINADVQDLYQKFLKHVPNRGRILDAGYGVGRDVPILHKYSSISRFLL
jgi:hypothetical protein